MSEQVRDFSNYGDNGQTFYPDFKDEFSIDMDPTAPEDVGPQVIHPRVQERIGNDEITEQEVKE